MKKNSEVSVSIPTGVDNGTRIRLANKGKAGMRGGLSGDLYILIHVSEHELFQRDNINLHCRVPISIAKAALGCSVKVPTIDGGLIRVRIPAESQSGRRMRLRGKGMQALRGDGHGDMFIELIVETPSNLTNRQKEMLREFDKTDENNHPESKGFLSAVKTFIERIKRDHAEN